MLSFMDQYTQVQRITMDFQTTTLTAIKLWINEAKNIILEDLGLEVTEETKTKTSVASQQDYDLTVRFWRMKAVKYTFGSIPHVLEAVENQDTWDLLNSQSSSNTSDIPTHYFIKRPYGINEAQLSLFPIPASSSNTITYTYETKDKDLKSDDYTAGTITLTNASATVTGSGTTFTAAMVGRFLRATDDGEWYRIESYTSATVITLNKIFEGTTAASLAYRIIDAMAVPERLHILPIYYAAAHVFMTKKDPQNEVKYLGLFNDGLDRAKKSIGMGKSTSQVFFAKQFRRPVTNPNYSPRTIT